MTPIRILQAASFVAVLLAGCESSSEQVPENNISGTVTIDGKPASFPMIVVRGPGGKEQSAPGKNDGTYRIYNPPTGPLTVWFAAGPPIPGAKSRPIGTIPEKYTTDESGLTIDYQGGPQTKDFDLKP